MTLGCRVQGKKTQSVREVFPFRLNLPSKKVRQPTATVLLPGDAAACPQLSTARLVLLTSSAINLDTYLGYNASAAIILATLAWVFAVELQQL